MGGAEPDEIVVETVGLTKFYGPFRGIEDVSLGIRRGEIFGFLGPNGAGKSTTIRSILSFLRPTRGEARVFGMDSLRESIEIRKRIGYLPAEGALYEEMTGREFLDFVGGFPGRRPSPFRERVLEALPVDLSRRIKACSRGMKQKILILQAFSHDPDLVILDEPTLGLDPLMQKAFYEILEEEKARGKTVFLSSHILSEVERVCDRIGIIRGGRLIAIERVEELRKKRVKVIEVTFRDSPPEPLRSLPGILQWEANGREVRFHYTGELNRLLETIGRRPVDNVTVQPASLEELFFEFYESPSDRQEPS